MGAILSPGEHGQAPRLARAKTDLRNISGSKRAVKKVLRFERPSSCARRITNSKKKLPDRGGCGVLFSDMDMVLISHLMFAREPGSKPAMLIEHLPLIATTTVVLCVFAFIADASSP